MVGLLATLSRHQPVVLVLDDLQWADKASLLLLRHLAAAERRCACSSSAPTATVSCRTSHPLRRHAGCAPPPAGVARVELAGLDDTGVVALMEAAAGHALDDAAVGLAHAVYRETDGNPFFVSEVLRHLAETGAIYQDATGRWVAATPSTAWRCPTACAR